MKSAKYPAWNEKLYRCLSLHSVNKHCNHLPDPTCTRFFVSWKIYIECCKVIPLSAVGTFSDSFLWPETSLETETSQHNLPALLHPIPRLNWCNRQTVISKKIDRLYENPLLAKVSSVSTTENCKKCLWLLISFLHNDSDTVWVDRYLAHSSTPQMEPTISKKEQDIFFSAGVKATVILIPFTNNYYPFAFYLLSLTGYICFPWKNWMVSSFHKVFTVGFKFVTLC